MVPSTSIIQLNTLLYTSKSFRNVVPNYNIAIWSYLSHFKWKFDGVKLLYLFYTIQVATTSLSPRNIVVISHLFQIGFWWYKEHTQFTQFNMFNQSYATTLECCKTMFQFYFEPSLAQYSPACFISQPYLTNILVISQAIYHVFLWHISGISQKYLRVSYASLMHLSYIYHENILHI